MPAQDPRFWEVPLSPEAFDEWAAAPLFGDDVPDVDDAQRARRERLRAEAIALIGQIVSMHLTDRQREVVRLYFYEGRTQEEIAAHLGISQQVVSRHLFGVMRDGRKVGGAIRKLREVLTQLGVDPSGWM